MGQVGQIEKDTHALSRYSIPTAPRHPVDKAQNNEIESHHALPYPPTRALPMLG